MVKRNTWILVGFFAILLVVVWAIPRWQAGHPLPTASPSPSSTTLLGADMGSIKEMKIATTDGRLVDIYPTGNSQWSATSQPDSMQLSVDQLQQAVTTIQELSVTTFLPTPPPMNVIGLTNPSYSITIIMDRGPQRMIKVGSVTPTGNGYYVQVDNNTPSVVDKSSLDSVLNLLVAPNVTTETPTTGGTVSPAETPVLNPAQTPSIPSATP